MHASGMWTSAWLLVSMLASTAVAVNVETVPVRNPANPADTEVMISEGSRNFGAVSYAYRIGKYEVTTSQYCEFLNAVARADPYGLYHPSMDTTVNAFGCNIRRTGSSGNFSYTVGDGSSHDIANWGTRPVNFVTWGGTARFSNWLTNGQPRGVLTGNAATDSQLTEDGSYALNGANDWSSLSAITRRDTAKYVIPSENEWYKAAYYDPNKPGGPGYWDYPTRSDTLPSNVLSATGTNNANFYDYFGAGNGGYTAGSPYYRTEVGAFTASLSPYGTFDQGGNITEWTEGKPYGVFRGNRGGSYCYYAESSAYSCLRASEWSNDIPDQTNRYLGFRIALVPEPSALALLLLGGLVLRRKATRAS